MPNTNSTDYCLACGNALPSSSAACEQCKVMSAGGTPSARDSTQGESTMNESAQFDRSERKRTAVDLAHHQAIQEAEPGDPRAGITLETEPGRNPQRVSPEATRMGATRMGAFLGGAALVALLAGGLYFAFVPVYGHGDSPLTADEVARNDIPRLVPDSLANAPFGSRTVSLDRAGTIEAVRLAMVRGELRDARARLAMLPASESEHGDVRQITNELIQRELARNAAMGLAHACEKAGDTPCVLRAAGDALASDVSDTEARDMLLRAVAQTGSPPAAAPAIIAPAAGTAVTANRRVDTARLVARRRAAERLIFRRETQAFANNSDIYARP